MSRPSDFAVLGLSRKQEKVLFALMRGDSCPLTLARTTHISRSAVYLILHNLTKRGIAQKRIIKGKSVWKISREQHIEEILFSVKKKLLSESPNIKKVTASNTHALIHYGRNSVRKRVNQILQTKDKKRIRGIQGDVSNAGWTKVFSSKEICVHNERQKENGIITEAIYPEGWIEKHATQLGLEWILSQIGRTRRGHVIHPRYFNHAAQMVVLEKSICLISFNEEIVVEIKNEEIRKMIISFYEFIQDNSQPIDSNAIYQRLLDEARRKQEKHKSELEKK